mgnify:CR=1 FL=1
MTKVTVSEAARLTRKSAKTIYRWLETGRLSYELNKENQKTIDLSELNRITEIRQPTTESDKTVSVRSAESKQIETLERLLSEKDARIQELSQDKQRLQALLEHKAEAPAPQPPPQTPQTPKLGWLSSRLGKIGL